MAAHPTVGKTPPKIPNSLGKDPGCSHARPAAFFSGFDPFTGNLKFCWLSVAHTVIAGVMDVSQSDIFPGTPDLISSPRCVRAPCSS